MDYDDWKLALPEEIPEHKCLFCGEECDDLFCSKECKKAYKSEN